MDNCNYCKWPDPPKGTNLRVCPICLRGYRTDPEYRKLMGELVIHQYWPTTIGISPQTRICGYNANSIIIDDFPEINSEIIKHIESFLAEK